MSSNPASASGAQEFSGKSVEEATGEGLRKMGLRAEEAAVEIVARGSRGLFGIGSEPAVVRIRALRAGELALPPAPPPPYAPPPTTPTPATRPAPPTPPAPSAPPAPPVLHAPPVPPQPTATSDEPASEPAVDPAAPSPERDRQVAAMAGEMLLKMVNLMGFEGRVATEWRDADAITDDRHLLLSVHGRELSALIGRRGETLENIQYLLRLMVNQKMHRWLNIIVDVEDYRAKRVDHLTHLAQRMADQVAQTGRAFALEPMPPNERRIVHLALRDHDKVFTESTGEGERRKVTIFPKR